MTLSTRDRDILELLIADYIASAQPVGSRTIAKHHPAHLSPATIRNVMADLEEKGYLIQPHTSAGRIPTARAMRYYVDSILNVRELDDDERRRIEQRYAGAREGLDSLLRRTSTILSAISHYAGIVAAPRAEQIAFKHIEFIPLSRTRLLGIFVAQSGMVQNRIIECSQEFTYPELERINNYCNGAFLGLTLSEAREKAERELSDERVEYDKLLKKAMTMSNELLQEVSDGNVMIDGEQKLMDAPEFSRVESLKQILAALEEKQMIVKLLDRCLESRGVHIFIGSESEFPVEGISMVTAPYRRKGKLIGTLGVIGPTRMDYSNVIPVVDFTAKLVSDLMELED
jgi:heat-inducible transcriptional repressor